MASNTTSNTSDITFARILLDISRQTSAVAAAIAPTAVSTAAAVAAVAATAATNTGVSSRRLIEKMIEIVYYINYTLSNIQTLGVDQHAQKVYLGQKIMTLIGSMQTFIMKLVMQYPPNTVEFSEVVILSAQASAIIATLSLMNHSVAKQLPDAQVKLQMCQKYIREVYTSLMKM